MNAILCEKIKILLFHKKWNLSFYSKIWWSYEFGYAVAFYTALILFIKFRLQPTPFCNMLRHCGLGCVVSRGGWPGENKNLGQKGCRITFLFMALRANPSWTLSHLLYRHTTLLVAFYGEFLPTSFTLPMSASLLLATKFLTREWRGSPRFWENKGFVFWTLGRTCRKRITCSVNCAW